MSVPPSSSPSPIVSVCPLPLTRRGYGIFLRIHPQSNRLIYCNGRSVFLRSISNPLDSLQFAEHKANVVVAAPSPSGHFIASGDEHGTVLIWSFPQLKLKYEYAVGKTVNDIDWDESSTRLLCAGDGHNKAKVISWDSGNTLGEITMHSAPIISAAYRRHRPFRVVTASEDLTVNMYDGPPFKYSQSYKGHSRYPNCIRFSPSGDECVSVGADGKIVVFDGKTLAVTKELVDETNGHRGAIYAFAFAPDGKRIVTVSADKSARVWNLETLKVDETFVLGERTDDQQVGCAWADDGTIITVSLSGHINYLTSGQSAPSRIIFGHQTSIQSLAVDKARSLFYTAALSGEILQWQRSGECRLISGGHNGKVVTSLCVASNGVLVSGGLDNAIRFTDTEALTVSDNGVDVGGSPVAIAVVPESHAVLVITGKDQLVIIGGNRNVLATIPLGFTPTALTLIAPDNKRIVIGGGAKNHQLHIYDVAVSDTTVTVNKVHSIVRHDKAVSALRSSADGRLIVSCDGEACVYVHSTSAPYDCYNKSGWRYHNAGVTDVDLSVEPLRLVTSSLDCALIVWDDLTTFSAAKRNKIPAAHTVSVETARFLDDRTVVSVGGDRAVRLWTL